MLRIRNSIVYDTLQQFGFSKHRLGAALMTCVVPYLPCDAVKIAIAAILINRLNKYIKL